MFQVPAWHVLSSEACYGGVHMSYPFLDGPNLSMVSFVRHVLYTLLNPLLGYPL